MAGLLNEKIAEMTKTNKYYLLEDCKIYVNNLEIDYEKLLLILKKKFYKTTTINSSTIPFCRLELLLRQIIINKIVLRHHKSDKISQLEREKVLKRLELFSQEAVSIIEELINSGCFVIEGEENSEYKILI